MISLFKRVLTSVRLFYSMLIEYIYTTEPIKEQKTTKVEETPIERRRRLTRESGSK